MLMFQRNMIRVANYSNHHQEWLSQKLEVGRVLKSWVCIIVLWNMPPELHPGSFDF
jgi:hypothetical protein